MLRSSWPFILTFFLRFPLILPSAPRNSGTNEVYYVVLYVTHILEHIFNVLVLRLHGMSGVTFLFPVASEEGGARGSQLFYTIKSKVANS